VRATDLGESAWRPSVQPKNSAEILENPGVHSACNADRTSAEASKYVTGRGGVEHFSLCRRVDELLVFVEVEGEIREVKETPVF
jgi:hypothetical protein